MNAPADPELRSRIDEALPDLQTRLLYSPNRAAELLDVSRSTVYGLMKSGALKYVSIGADRRIPHEELVRLAKEGAAK